MADVEFTIGSVDQTAAGIDNVVSRMANLQRKAVELTTTFEHLTRGFNQDYIGGLSRGSASTDQFAQKLMQTASTTKLTTTEIQHMAEGSGLFTTKQLEAAAAEERVARKAEELSRAVAEGKMTTREAGEQFGIFAKQNEVLGDATAKASSGFMSMAKSLLAPVLAFASVTGAIKLFTDTLKASITEAAAEESGFVSLAATIESMGLSASVSASGIRTMAEAMQAANGIFSHDDIEKAAQALLRIEGFDPSKLQETLKTIQDFAAGTGQTMEAAGQQIAMALETGQTRSLRFSAAIRTQVQEMISAGDQAGALSLIMDTLSSKWGGQAAASLDTYNGKVQVLKNSWGELLATMGGQALGPGKGALSDLNSFVVSMTQLLQISQEYKGVSLAAGYGIFQGLGGDEAAMAIVKQGAAVKELNQLYRELQTLKGREALRPTSQVAAEKEAAQAKSVAEGIDNITRAYTAQAEAAEKAGQAGVAGLDAQTEAAQMAAATLKEHEAGYSGIISFATSYDKIAGSIADKEAEIAEARRRGYSDSGTKIKGLLGDLASLEEQQTQLTNTFLLSMYSIKLAADGFQDADVAAYLGFATALGVISGEAESAALALWGTYAAQIALVNAPQFPAMPEYGVTPGVIPQGVGSVVMPNLPATAEAATAAGNLDTIAGSANGLALNLNEANTNAGKLAEAIGKIPPDFERIYDMTFRINTQNASEPIPEWAGGWLPTLSSGGMITNQGDAYRTDTRISHAGNATSSVYNNWYSRGGDMMTRNADIIIPKMSPVIIPALAAGETINDEDISSVNNYYSKGGDISVTSPRITFPEIPAPHIAIFARGGELPDIHNTIIPKMSPVIIPALAAGETINNEDISSVNNYYSKGGDISVTSPRITFPEIPAPHIAILARGGELPDIHNTIIPNIIPSANIGRPVGPGAFVGDAPGGKPTPYMEFVERISYDKYYVHNAQETRQMIDNGQISMAGGGMLAGGGTLPAQPQNDSLREEMRAMRNEFSNIMRTLPTWIRDAVQQVV